jgi:predicted nucleotidyltransferase
MQQDILSTLTLSENKQRLQGLSIKHLWLFGSRAKWWSSADSDIDLLYEIDSSVDQGSFAFFSWILFLKTLFGDNIDYVSINHIHPDIKQEVLATKRMIW